MSNTLLRYDLTTDPFPLQASPSEKKPHESSGVEGSPVVATLTVVASNPNPSVTINTQPGTCQLTIKEGSAGNPAAPLYVTKFPNGWGAVSFWVDPTNGPYQGSTTPHWSGPAQATYTIQYALGGQVVNVPAQGEPALAPQGQYPAQGAPLLTLDQTTYFTLNVDETIEGDSYHAQDQKVVTVEMPAPQLTFSTNPASVDVANPAPIHLQWTSANASEIAIDGVGNFTGAQAASGSTPVNPDATAVYFATAYGLPGYTGPPALAQATVLFTGSQTSAWCDVWKGVDNPFWMLDLGHGYQPFQLYLSLNDIDGPNGQQVFHEVNALLTDGVLAADLGKQGLHTPYSKVLGAHYGGYLPNSGLYRAINEQPENPSPPWREELENVGQTWALKFPDGRLALVWYASGQSDGGGIHHDKWNFTFGWGYYGPLSH